MPRCQFSLCTGRSIASATPEPFQRRLVLSYYDLLYCKMPWVVPVGRKVLNKNSAKRPPSSGTKPAVSSTSASTEIMPGDWVEVRPFEEISSELDARGRLNGLNFMPEMKKFCGGRFKVFKRVNRILLESTGELRNIKRPTYYLEGVYCDGGSHQQCDRSCFLLWRGDWLRKVDGP